MSWAAASASSKPAPRGSCARSGGRIDYRRLWTLLGEIGYGGYITIEQERDPRNTGSILADLAASRAFLREIGF